MRFDIATLFPEMCDAVMNESIIGRARRAGFIEAYCHHIRSYSTDKHGRVDDAPYGGGMGMLLQIQPIEACIEAVTQELGHKPHVIYLSPQGETFTQKKAQQLLEYPEIFLLCGHYEGIDERIIDTLVDEQISAGDYVLTGGELPALMVADAVARLCPGVLSEDVCFEEESHQSGLLEYPQYTRPLEWRGIGVPPVLLSGHHANIARWRREQSLLRTWKKRPDMLETAPLTEADRKYLAALQKEEEEG